MKPNEILYLRTHLADLPRFPAKKAIRRKLAPLLALCGALALAGCSTGLSGNVGNGSGGTTAPIP